jgi:hypothetical protein
VEVGQKAVQFLDPVFRQIEFDDGKREDYDSFLNSVAGQVDVEKVVKIREVERKKKF